MSFNHLKVIFTILIFVEIISCNNNPVDSISEKKKRYNELKDRIADSLTSVYKVSYCWDTLDRPYKLSTYTIDFNPVINSNYQIITDAMITNIFERKDTSYVSIVAGKYGSFYLDFPITKNQEDLLKHRDRDYIFIVRVSKISKIKFVISGDLGDESSSTVELNLDYSPSFTGGGIVEQIIPINKYYLE